jgi:apolipoprotein N-acyltransferase
MVIHLRYLSLSLLSAGLLSLAWYPLPLWPLVFVGFVPLLYLHKLTAKQGQTAVFAVYTFISLLLWNVGTTWWVWNASEGGAIAAFLLNALFMLMPWVLLFKTQPIVGYKRAQWLFISAWIAYEFLHLNWEFSWPWLVLGNVFAPVPSVVQWYEYTGHLGGTLWVLWANVQIYRLWQEGFGTDTLFRKKMIFRTLFWIFAFPLFASWYVLDQFNYKGRAIDVVVVQPNIDPYKEKFSGLSAIEQAQQMTKLADDIIDSKTQLVCFPETALVGGLNEDAIEQEQTYQYMLRWQQNYPGLNVLTGIDSYRLFPVWEKSPTARRYNDHLFYDAYNSAILIDPNRNYELYHKSKLVPGVEKMPYPHMFGFLEKLTINMGGTSGSLGSDIEPKVFTLDSRTQIAPVICYESVYGEYVSRYVRKGANLICIITNDGWWGNTPGYKQHFEYARLRAIETRRYVVRSANTGISGFVDDKGNVLSKSGWWQETALKQTVFLNDYTTFYSRYGDILGIIFWAFFVIRMMEWVRLRKIKRTI